MHSHPNSLQQQGKDSGSLDFHRIDTETLGSAVNDMNHIAEQHATLLRNNSDIAAQMLRYENLLIDAHGGDSTALKKATSTDEFDKLLDMVAQYSPANTTPLQENAVPKLDYLALQNDLMEFRARFLSASHL